MNHLKPLPLRQHRGEKRERQFVPPIKPTPTEQSSIAAPQKLPSAGRAPALTAELDPELQAYAEAAIQTFRLNFDTALTENSPVTRERLRQAASNLMRAAVSGHHYADGGSVGRRGRESSYAKINHGPLPQYS